MEKKTANSDDERKRTLKAEQLYNRALLSIETGQHDYATTLLKNALAIDPTFVKALEGIKLAKTRKLQQSGIISLKVKTTIFLLQAFFNEHFKKYSKALDKYESLLALMRPPLVILPHLGDVYLANGLIQSASTAYRAVLQSDPDHIHSLRKLGKIYLNDGKFSQAKNIYDHLSTVVSNDKMVMKEVHDAYALITIDKGHWEEDVSFRKKVAGATEGEEEVAEEAAEETPVQSDITGQIKMVKRNLEKEPHNTKLRKQLATLLIETDQKTEAITELVRIADLDPKDTATIETLAGLYRDRDDFPNAVKQYDRLSESFPQRTDILNALAELYTEQDAPEKAIETYKRLLKISPDAVPAHEMLGRLYQQTRYFEEATREYEKLTELSPDRTDVMEILANLYLRSGKHSKARENFEKVAQADKMNINVRKILADLYFGAGMMKEAEKTYGEILEVNPDDIAAKASLQKVEATVLDRKAEIIEKEIKEYEKTLEQQPDSQELKKKMEDAKQKKLDLRIEALEDRVKAEPDNVEFRYLLGSALMEKGFFDKALTELQLTVKDETRNVDSMHLIGVCFEKKNMLDIAAKQLERAAAKIVEMDAKKKEILYDLGGVYEKMNQPENALAKYKEIYEVDIGYKDVSEKVDKAYKLYRS